MSGVPGIDGHLDNDAGLAGEFLAQPRNLTMAAWGSSDTNQDLNATGRDLVSGSAKEAMRQDRAPCSW